MKHETNKGPWTINKHGSICNAEGGAIATMSKSPAVYPDAMERARVMCAAIAKAKGE